MDDSAFMVTIEGPRSPNYTGCPAFMTRSSPRIRFGGDQPTDVPRSDSAVAFPDA